MPTGDVVIEKSDDPLRAAGTDAGGNLYHTDEAADARGTRVGERDTSATWRPGISARGGRAWGNVLLGGVVGGIIDADTDAHREYPGTIDVPCP